MDAPNKLREKVYLYILLSFIIITGVVVRVSIQSIEPLNSDEFFSLIRSSAPPLDVVFNDDLTSNPPLHNILVYVTSFFCDRLLAVKIVFHLIGFLLIPATYITAKKWFGAAAAVATSFLIAASTVYGDTGGDIRGYGLAWLFLMAALYYYHDVVTNNKGYGPFILLSSLAVYSHYIALIIFFFQSVLIIGALRRRGNLLPYLAAASINLPALGYMFYGSFIAKTGYVESHPPPLGQAAEFIAHLGGRIEHISSLFVGLIILISVFLLTDKKHRRFPTIYLLAMFPLLIAAFFYPIRHSCGMFFPPFLWMAFFGAGFKRKEITIRILTILILAVLLTNCCFSFAYRRNYLTRINAEAIQTVSLLKSRNIKDVYAIPQTAPLHLFGVCIQDIPLFSLSIRQLSQQPRNALTAPGCPMAFHVVDTDHLPSAQGGCEHGAQPFAFVYRLPPKPVYSFSNEQAILHSIKQDITDRYESNKHSCTPVFKGILMETFYCNPCGRGVKER